MLGMAMTNLVATMPSRRLNTHTLPLQPGRAVCLFDSLYPFFPAEYGRLARLAGRRGVRVER